MTERLTPAEQRARKVIAKELALDLEDYRFECADGVLTALRAAGIRQGGTCETCRRKDRRCACNACGYQDCSRWEPKP